MKKLMLVIIVTTAITLSFISCEKQPEEVDGEAMVRELWDAMQSANIDYLDDLLDPAFQSVHQDGARDKSEELELLKKLNMGEYELTDFIVTRNNNTLNVTYFVNVTETIEDETYTRKSARLTVFSKTPQGWKWIAHANLLPMK